MEKLKKKQKDKTVVSTVPAELHERLSQEAAENDRSISKEIKRILVMYFDKIDLEARGAK